MFELWERSQEKMPEILEKSGNFMRGKSGNPVFNHKILN